MSENQYTPTLTGGADAVGVELQTQDASGIGAVSGLADDRVLAELFRIPVFNSTAFRRIVPFATAGTLGGPIGTAGCVSTVTTTANANASVIVNPFRAIVGSRSSSTASVAASLNTWRDVRSSVWVGSGSSIGTTLVLAPNSSGNARWDLIYAAVTVDAQAGPTTRRIKDPSAGSVSAQNVFLYMASSVTPTVVTGTPGATPAVPTVPADSGNVFNIPLAVVRVPNGFGSGSTIGVNDIRDYVNGIASSDTASISTQALGGSRCCPANGNNDGNPTYASDPNFQWVAATSGTAPSIWLPPQMLGKEERFVAMDFVTPSHHSHPTGSTVDSSVDWRNRYFKSYVAVVDPSLFPSFPVFFGSDVSILSTSDTFPRPGTENFVGMQMGNSFNVHPGQGQSICDIDQTFCSLLPSGAEISLSVAPSGILIVTVAATEPGTRIFVWVEATGQRPF